MKEPEDPFEDKLPKDRRIADPMGRPIEDWIIRVFIPQFIRVLSYALVLVGLFIFVNVCFLKPLAKTTLSILKSLHISKIDFLCTFLGLYVKTHFTVLFLKVADKILISLTVVVSGSSLIVVYRKLRISRISDAIKGIDVSILSMVIITLAVSFLTSVLDNTKIDFDYGFSIGFVIFCIALYLYVSFLKDRQENNSFNKADTNPSSDEISDKKD